MTIAILLAVLAITDCVLCGFRGAAGTEGRLHKRVFYTSAVLRALGAGVALVSALALLTCLLVITSEDVGETWASFLAAGRICVIAFATFASIIFAAFAFYFAPIGDFRVLTNVIVFGPLTLLRPYVIAVGLAAAAFAAANTRVTVVAVVAGIAMLLFQRMIQRPYIHRWRRLLVPRTHK